MIEAETARVVISLHGIRTRGKWQKELAPLLNQSGFTAVLSDYGYFNALELLLPWSREKRVKWFLDEYIRERNRLHYVRPWPSIIAHSFGTYLVASAMQKYPQINFDRIIFCGSIVKCDFPWVSLRREDKCERCSTNTVAGISGRLS